MQHEYKDDRQVGDRRVAKQHWADQRNIGQRAKRDGLELTLRRQTGDVEVAG